MNPPEDECRHVIHEWPVIGPWVDYTCANCGKEWRIPWLDPFPTIPMQTP